MSGVVPTLGGLDWSGPGRDALEADFMQALDAAGQPGAVVEFEEGP